MLVPHRPDGAITSMIFVSLPWWSTDVQVRVRRFGEHHHCSGVPHDSGKTSGFGIEGPKNHPVWTDGDRRARGVERVCIASLRCSVQHVNQARRGVRWFWLSAKNILKPDHTHWIESHIRPSNNILIARDAHPIVGAGTKHRQFPWWSISAMVASAVTDDGPANIARRIFSFLSSSAMRFSSAIARSWISWGLNEASPAPDSAATPINFRRARGSLAAFCSVEMFLGLITWPFHP